MDVERTGIEAPRRTAAAVLVAEAACAGGSDETPLLMGEEGVGALEKGGVGPRDRHPWPTLRGSAAQAAGIVLLSGSVGGVFVSETAFGDAVLGFFAPLGGPNLI